MRVFKRILIVLVLLIAVLEAFQLATEDTSFTSSLANLVVENNFHEVVPQRFYRSGEMVPSELAEHVREHGIKTVIDLRYGVEEPGSRYYGEAEAAEKEGAKYFHFPMLGSRVASFSEMKSLLELFDKVETPLLVHCSSGSHRSALVSAAWLMDKENVPPEDAQTQFSRKYGFFLAERKLKSWIQGKPTIDQVLWSYLSEGAKNGLSFRQWVEQGASKSDDITPAEPK